jgi:hypothetical protein
LRGFSGFEGLGIFWGIWRVGRRGWWAGRGNAWGVRGLRALPLHQGIENLIFEVYKSGI